MLKEKVIDFLKKNPDSLDMGTYLCKSHKTSCGTIGCLAGHIVNVSDFELREGNLTALHPVLDNLNETELKEFDKWHKYETDNGFADYYNTIPVLARYLWAKEYGDEAAEQLPFYEADWDDVVGFTEYQINEAGSEDEAFYALTAQDVTDFLESIG